MLLFFKFKIKEQNNKNKYPWVYIIFASAELTVSTVGMSMVSAIIPEKHTAIMMGVFLLTIGLGGKFGGAFAKFAHVPEACRNSLTEIASMYNNAFLYIRY